MVEPLPHTMFSLFVQFEEFEQARLLTRMLGGSAATPSPADGRPPCTTPHSTSACPARMLSCISSFNDVICEQSMPALVICAVADVGWSTHAASRSAGSTK